MAAETHTMLSVLKSRAPYTNKDKGEAVQQLTDVNSDKPEEADALRRLQPLRGRQFVRNRNAATLAGNLILAAKVADESAWFRKQAPASRNPLAVALRRAQSMRDKSQRMAQQRNAEDAEKLQRAQQRDERTAQKSTGDFLQLFEGKSRAYVDERMRLAANDGRGECPGCGKMRLAYAPGRSPEECDAKMQEAKTKHEAEKLEHLEAQERAGTNKRFKAFKPSAEATAFLVHVGGPGVHCSAAIDGGACFDCAPGPGCKQDLHRRPGSQELVCRCVTCLDDCTWSGPAHSHTSALHEAKLQREMQQEGQGQQRGNESFVNLLLSGAQKARENHGDGISTEQAAMAAMHALHRKGGADRYEHAQKELQGAFGRPTSQLTCSDGSTFDFAGRNSGGAAGDDARFARNRLSHAAAPCRDDGGCGSAASATAEPHVDDVHLALAISASEEEQRLADMRSSAATAALNHAVALSMVQTGGHEDEDSGDVFDNGEGVCEFTPDAASAMNRAPLSPIATGRNADHCGSAKRRKQAKRELEAARAAGEISKGTFERGRSVVGADGGSPNKRFRKAIDERSSEDEGKDESVKGWLLATEMGVLSQ